MKRLIIPILLLVAPSIHSLEIPLQRGASNVRQGQVIAFIDMDQVYQEFPETQKARKEYEEKVNIVYQELADKEAGLADLREQLAILREAAVADSLPIVSTSPATTPAQGGVNSVGDLSGKESMLAEQEASLTEAKSLAVQNLKEFERKRAAQVFGKLYQSLVQLADEKGVDLVLDKKSLVYGQGSLDLTEALTRRVRGLPDLEDQQ
jgi:Skp family chaperone for outer membrane proteins